MTIADATAERDRETKENTMSSAAMKPSQEIGLVQTQQPRETSIMEIIASASTNKDVDVDKLGKLLAMAKEQRAEEAEQVFNVAMNKAQADIRPIAADASNPQTKSKYASYLALDRVLRPIYVRHGFSLSFDTGDSAPDMIRVLCYLSHDAGHSRTYKVDMPADGKGAKGGDVMTKTHATGAAMSYGQRYLLKMIFNIAVGEDHDGNDPVTSGPISADQAQRLRELLERSGSDVERFCAYFKIDSVPALMAKDFERAIVAINDRNKQVRK